MLRRLFYLLSFSTLIACTSPSTPPADEIRVALESAPKTIDPRRATDANGQRLAALVFQSFIKLGPEMQIIGDAAQTYQLKAKEIQLNVRANLKFSDGSLVTKEDIVFSFAEYQKEASLFAASFREIEKVEVLGDENQGFVVKLKLNKDSASLLTSLSLLKLLPKKIFSGKDNISPLEMRGTGPYQIVSYQSQEIVLQKNPHFPTSPGHEKLRFKIIKDDNTRYLKLIKGEVDIAPNVLSPQSTKKLLANPDFQSFRSPGLAMNYLLINLKDPWLASKPVRQAIAHSIDRDSILQYKLEGLASPASSLLTPSNPFFHGQLPVPDFSLTAAKKLLEGQDLSQIRLKIKSSNQPSAVDNAKVLAHQISQLGISVDTESFEWGTYFEDIKNGNFQIAVLRWVGATDPDIYRVAFHSQELAPQGRNRGFYQNPTLDSLLSQGPSILDTEKRRQHYLKVQEIVAKDLPIIPLWYNEEVNFVAKDVEGFQISKTGDFSYFPLLVRKISKR